MPIASSCSISSLPYIHTHNTSSSVGGDDTIIALSRRSKSADPATFKKTSKLTFLEAVTVLEPAFESAPLIDDFSPAVQVPENSHIVFEDSGY